MITSLLLSTATALSVPPANSVSPKPLVERAMDCVELRQDLNENAFQIEGRAILATVVVRDKVRIHLIISGGTEDDIFYYVDGTNYKSIDGQLDFLPTDFSSPPAAVDQAQYEKYLQHLAQSCPTVA